MLTIDFLADHLDTIPTLAKCFRDQWPDYYANKPEAQMVQDFLSEAARERIPSRLVAFKSGGFAGTIVLREHGSETLSGFQPELGGLYVMKHYRGQGIGTELIRAGMKLARFDPKRGCPKRSGQPLAFVAKLFLDVTDQEHNCYYVITCIDYTCINQLHL